MEKVQQFLEKDFNLVKLAKILKTNTKYVSKIIHYHNVKKPIDYVSYLKIDYILEKLKSETKFRNYTPEALGKGRLASDRLITSTKAFKNRNGVSPTYFIKELQKAHLAKS